MYQWCTTEVNTVGTTCSEALKNYENLNIWVYICRANSMITFYMKFHQKMRKIQVFHVSVSFTYVVPMSPNTSQKRRRTISGGAHNRLDLKEQVQSSHSDFPVCLLETRHPP